MKKSDCGILVAFFYNYADIETTKNMKKAIFLRLFSHIFIKMLDLQLTK